MSGAAEQDTARPRSGDARWAAALSRALERYADDAPLAEAAEPLVAVVEELCPGWRAGLVQLPAEHGAVNFICGPSWSPDEARDLCARIDPRRYRPASPDFAIEIAEAPLADGRGPIAIARLLISDDHAVGLLVLRGGAGARPPVASPALRALARVLALMLEDRLSVSSLLEREAVLKTVLDTAPDAIIRIGDDGLIRSFSRSAERLFGYSAPEAIGRPVSVLMTSEHASRHQNYIDRYIHSGQRRLANWQRRFTARRRDGGEFPIELAIDDVEVEGRRQFVAVIRDVTERVRDETRQAQLRETIQHAAQLSALGEMAATIAHEVNQPLTAVANYLDAASAMLEGPGETDLAALGEYIAQARRQADVGGDIIKRVRRLTLRAAPERVEVDVNAAIEETLASLQRLASAKGVTLERRYADPPPVAHVDQIQVQQVVANLVRNAVEAACDHGMRRVRVRTGAGADSVDVEVSDTGAGVPVDMRESIFDSFVTTREGGVGLGLSVSRSIVEAHGGAIWVEDADDGGARFHVRLPRRAA